MSLSKEERVKEALSQLVALKAQRAPSEDAVQVTIPLELWIELTSLSVLVDEPLTQ